MQTRRVQVAGISLHVAEQGEDRPLLLVHGFPLDHSMWRHQVESLSASYRVIAPDLRGFGQSHGIGDHVCRMEQYADDLARLLDELNVHEPVALCGLSMGGYIAWQFWARHRAKLDRLILCDTRSAADSADAAKARLENAERVMREGTSVVAEAMLGKLFAEETVREQPEVVEATRQQMLRAPREGVAAALRGMAERPDFTPLLPRIDLPVLVLCGEKDAISPPDEMQAIARAIPSAEYVEIARAGHLAPLEQPAAVNDALRAFLARPAQR